MKSYDWPPSDPSAADDWASDNHESAVAYSAQWVHSGAGYGAQALVEWPECPGFDWECGAPEWSGIREDLDYEYRTVLCNYLPGVRDPGGWERVASFLVNPEPELYDEQGTVTGYMYIGDGAAEVVYRRLYADEEIDD